MPLGLNIAPMLRLGYEHRRVLLLPRVPPRFSDVRGARCCVLPIVLGTERKKVFEIDAQASSCTEMALTGQDATAVSRSQSPFGFMTLDFPSSSSANTSGQRLTQTPHPMQSSRSTLGTFLGAIFDACSVNRVVKNFIALPKRYKHHPCGYAANKIALKRINSGEVLSGASCRWALPVVVNVTRHLS